MKKRLIGLSDIAKESCLMISQRAPDLGRPHQELSVLLAIGLGRVSSKIPDPHLDQAKFQRR
eukprot:m.17509 g.17509  ORF g.17509 m.17509 type:complete len:62 (+) comp29279_c0_seq1:1066-1251(+)